MQSYRFARRSFLAGIGGAFGLEILLGNLEAAAEGLSPPPRFLMMHWPVGTIRNQFIPAGSGSSYTTAKTGQGPGYIISPYFDYLSFLFDRRWRHPAEDRKSVV